MISVFLPRSRRTKQNMELRILIDVRELSTTLMSIYFPQFPQSFAELKSAGSGLFVRPCGCRNFPFISRRFRRVTQNKKLRVL